MVECKGEWIQASYSEEPRKLGYRIDSDWKCVAILLFWRIRVNVLKVKHLAEDQPPKRLNEERPKLNNTEGHFKGISHLSDVLLLYISKLPEVSGNTHHLDLKK